MKGKMRYYLFVLRLSPPSRKVESPSLSSSAYHFVVEILNIDGEIPG